MPLPVAISLAPMEARLVAELPAGEGWQYEPKWDGFRCLVFKDGSTVDLRSKTGQPFNRYFPELVAAIETLPAVQVVLDGEIVVPVEDSLSFDELLLRIHPAASRVAKLAALHPAHFIAFDLLVDEGGASLAQCPLAERRPALEAFAATHFARRSQLHVSPASADLQDVHEWLRGLGTNVDGIVAKRLQRPYESGKRTGMEKWKRLRSADCVVGGFRYGTGSDVVGSMLLGLFDGEGLLHHVGFTSNIPRSSRAALTKKLEALRQAPGFTGRAPGGPSRWSTERSGAWEPLAPTLVAEVQYDHFSGGRFRHGTRFLRWRPDKAPRDCSLAQVAREAGSFSALLHRDAATPR